MKSAYPVKKVGQIYEDPIDGIRFEVTYAWHDGSALMRHLNGPLSGREDCIGGWSVFTLVHDVDAQAA